MSTHLIDKLGSEVTWVLYKSDPGWLVTASHTDGEPANSFQISARRPDLDDAIKAVYNELALHGPDWLRFGI